MQTINPYTLESLNVPETKDLQSIFQQSSAAFDRWSSCLISERARLLKVALDNLSQRRREFAHIISEEIGKPITAAGLEFDRTLDEFNFSLANAHEFLAPERLPDAEIHFAPLGVVAVIAPWNFPFLLPLRGIVPALLAGNSVIFKPSELSPRIGIALKEAFPEEIPLFIAIGGKELGAQVVDLPVRAIAFTGSTTVGKYIAREAAGSLKRVILELGGLDAAIVLADADMPHAAREIVRANARNAGQVCNAIKRVFVHFDSYSRFVSEAIEAAKMLRYGDPLNESTEVGPLVSRAQWDRVKGYLDDAESRGAKIFQVVAPMIGYTFPQAILSDVPDSAQMLSEEPFGPLLPIISFTSEDEAVTRTNNTRYGLSASVWTRDEAAFRRISARLDVGLVRRNTHSAMRSGIPWGGTKESGVGRMKTREGMREFANVRVVA